MFRPVVRPTDAPPPPREGPAKVPAPSSLPLLRKVIRREGVRGCRALVAYDQGLPQDGE